MVTYVTQCGCGVSRQETCQNRTLVASLEPRWSQGSDASRRRTRLALCTGGGPGAGRAGAAVARSPRATAPTRPDPAREKVGHRRGLMDPWGKRGPGPPGPATDPLLIISNRLMGGGDGGDYG